MKALKKPEACFLLSGMMVTLAKMADRCKWMTPLMRSQIDTAIAAISNLKNNIRDHDSI